jgi:hypothetical protein
VRASNLHPLAHALLGDRDRVCSFCDRCQIRRVVDLHRPRVKLVKVALEPVRGFVDFSL